MNLIALPVAQVNMDTKEGSGMLIVGIWEDVSSEVLSGKDETGLIQLTRSDSVAYGVSSLLILAGESKSLLIVSLVKNPAGSGETKAHL